MLGCSYTSALRNNCTSLAVVNYFFAAAASQRSAVDTITRPVQSAFCLQGLASLSYLPHSRVRLVAAVHHALVAIVVQWLTVDTSTWPVERASRFMLLAVLCVYLPHVTCAFVCCGHSHSRCCSYATVGGGHSNLASAKCVLLAGFGCTCLSPLRYATCVFVCCGQ